MNATERASMDPIAASPQSGCLIWQTPTHWRMTAGGIEHSISAKTSYRDIATEVREFTKQAGSNARRCVLAIASTECFFVNLPVEEIGGSKDRAAVAFELERFFPLDAEAMVADHTIDRAGKRIAALSIESQRQRDLIEELETHEIDVASVLPASFLMARGLVESNDVPDRFEMILGSGDDFESLLVDTDGIWQWKTLFGETGLRQHLALTTDESCPIVLLECGELQVESSRPVQRSDRTTGRLAVLGADQALSGKWGRWFELRRGALAPSDPLRAVATPLRWLAMTAATCLILISLAAGYRGQRISDTIAKIKDDQRAAFKDAFPDRRIPVMLARTIRSEHRRALGARGKGDAIKLPTPATNVLRRLYAGLENVSASGARFRVTDFSINDGECSLTIRTRNSVDIGAIAKALESIGFAVQPPGSEQIDPTKEEPIATYESTINAIWNEDNRRRSDSP
ncbi:MAG: type II secretion system protein GspL [Planctomycetota bacterium]